VISHLTGKYGLKPIIRSPFELNKPDYLLWGWAGLLPLELF
jgi:hypothetical protein